MAIDAWARIDVTTLNKHIDGFTKPIFVKNYLLAGMKSRGRIKNNQSGKKFDWRAQFREGDPSDIDDMEPRGAQRTNFWKDAELPYRGCEVTESVSKYEKLANKGTEGLIDILDEMMPIMTQTMNDYFSAQLYVDGTTAANSKKIHGFESWFAGATANSKRCAANAQTDYAGNSTVLGAAGGAWESGVDWPDATGTFHDREYEWWTGPVWDYTDTTAAVSGGWAVVTGTWAANYREVLERATMNFMLRKYKPDVYLLAPDLYQGLQHALTSNESIQIHRAETGSLAIQLGFDALSFQGIDLVTEWNMPAATGYGIIFSELTLRNMQGQLFVFEKDYDWRMKSDLIGLDFYGNMNISSPRASCKFGAIT